MSHARPSAQDVIDLTGTSLSSSDVSPHVDWAERVVAEHLEDTANAAETLTQIETYLSAYSLSQRDSDLDIASMGLGDASVSYDDAVDGNRWMNMAIQLDRSGNLAAAMNPEKRPVSYKTGTYAT